MAPIEAAKTWKSPSFEERRAIRVSVCFVWAGLGGAGEIVWAGMSGSAARSGGRDSHALNLIGGVGVESGDVIDDARAIGRVLIQSILFRMCLAVLVDPPHAQEQVIPAVLHHDAAVLQVNRNFAKLGAVRRSKLFKLGRCGLRVDCDAKAGASRLTGKRDDLSRGVDRLGLLKEIRKTVMPTFGGKLFDQHALLRHVEIDRCRDRLTLTAQLALTAHLLVVRGKHVNSVEMNVDVVFGGERARATEVLAAIQNGFAPAGPFAGMATLLQADASSMIGMDLTIVFTGRSQAGDRYSEEGDDDDTVDDGPEYGFIMLEATPRREAISRSVDQHDDRRHSRGNQQELETTGKAVVPSGGAAAAECGVAKGAKSIPKRHDSQDNEQIDKVLHNSTPSCEL